jgi:hypothetical protein
MRVASVAGIVVALSAISVAHAQQQQPTPHAGYVYPAGGQRGTTFQVKVGGEFLNGVAQAFVSGGGVRVRVLEYDRLLQGQQLTALRDTAQALVKELQQKGGNDPAMRKRIFDIRDKVGDAVRRRANPSLADIVTLEVTVDRDAEIGERRLRLETPVGLTDPLVFCVGQLPEFREKENKATRADGELTITLPAIVNGRIVPGEIGRAGAPMRAPPQYMAGDEDRYRFHARKGQQIVAAVSARTLMPYLGDAVPGWFQATLTLFDANGHELAYDDDYQFRPDPVIHFAIPDDGDYVLEIKDALFRGREDFVYRIAIGELPFLTSVFPLGGRVGDHSDVALTGWNLPIERLVMDGKRRDKLPGVQPIMSRGESPALNSLPFGVDTLPEVMEKEPNDSRAVSQPVTLPVIVNGRVGRPGDRDVFAFDARAGDTVVAEVYARRLESPLDAVLELTDATGKRLAWNDDHEDKGAGLETHHADSWLTATLPASGRYYVQLRDVQQKGGAEYAYRLRISAPRPDFELRVSPSSINVAGGNTVPVTVTALRRDGFSGEIAVELTNASRGFVLSGGVVPAGQDQVRMTLTAPPPAGQPTGQQNATPEPVALELMGRAVIGGRPIAHRAVPADDMMQAFFYRHLVPADDTWVAVLQRGATRVSSRILTALPVKLPAGSAVQLRVAIPPGYRTFKNLEFQLSEPPEGVTLTGLSFDASGASFSIQTDLAKLKPGRRGNLIVEIIGERVPPANAAAPANAASTATPAAAPRPAAQAQRVRLGMLPAIPFEVVK